MLLLARSLSVHHALVVFGWMFVANAIYPAVKVTPLAAILLALFIRTDGGDAVRLCLLLLHERI